MIFAYKETRIFYNDDLLYFYVSLRDLYGDMGLTRRRPLRK